MVAKKKDGAGPGYVPLRLSSEILGRVEAHLARMQKASPGVSLSRADALRSLLLVGLGQAEAVSGA